MHPPGPLRQKTGGQTQEHPRRNEVRKQTRGGQSPCQDEGDCRQEADEEETDYHHPNFLPGFNERRVDPISHVRTQEMERKPGKEGQ